MQRRFTLALLALGALVVPSERAAAQIMLSEPASVMQQIDGTRITLEYYRPRARGRSPLFGQDAVVWEKVWTPGANWSTKLSFEKPITLNGVDIPPGTWSVWMEMSEDEFVPETFILDPEPVIFHTQGPPEREGQIRMPVSLQEADGFTEVLTWNFTDVRNDGATLAMHWGDRKAEFDIGVEPSMSLTATAEQARPVVGMYDIAFGPGMAPPPGAPPMPEMPDMTLEISWESDTGWLKADMEGTPDDFMNMVDLRLMPFAEGIFMPTEFWEEGVYNAWEAFVEFEYDGDGAVTGFLIRDAITDEVIFEGRRSDG